MRTRLLFSRGRENVLFMAAIARDGYVDGSMQIRPGYAKAVVAAIIDHHVGAVRHVAVDAAGAARFVGMMIGRGKPGRGVALPRGRAGGA